MTEEDQESATIIAMPIEKREPPEPPAPVDECDRWISVAFIACGIAQSDEGGRRLLLWSLLDKFADVPDVWDPDVMPTRDNAPALARYAVKKLLQALTASDDERQRAARAMDILFERLFSREARQRGIDVRPPSPAPQLTGKSHDEMVEIMQAWFFENFEDPAESTPYESAEGGYQYIWGGPYDANEELQSAFLSNVQPADPAFEPIENAIKEAVKEIEEHGWDWTPHSNRMDEER